MHHSMPPSKNGWPSLNMLIFPPVMRQVLDELKGHHFSSDVEVIAAAGSWLDGQVLSFVGSMLNKSRAWSL